jgi:hypothetical protein
MTMAETVTSGRASRWTSILLWVVALALMLSSAVYQRLTGPTHPLRGSLVVDDSSTAYRLLRSHETSRPATVGIPQPGDDATATLHWRRYPTAEAFTAQPMRSSDGRLEGELPLQPAAGKLEYFLVLDLPQGPVRLPDGEPVVLRYKDPVPTGALAPHVLLMFFGVFFGLRAGLAALFAPRGLRWLSWTTLGMLTVGGMVLGPVVQKYAFGAFWTGWPHGSDLTDNKALVMWLAWILACAVIGGPSRRLERRHRAAVLVAALVMTVVYLIPHSLRGSELDYRAVDAGVPPPEAIGTGDR